MRNARLNEHKLESRLPGEISITSDMQMTPPLWQKERASWWKWKRRVKKAGLKLSIQKMKIMASGSITSWQIDGETMEIVRLYFLGSKITAVGDCSHEIKRCWLLGRKAMTKLDSILKSRGIILSTKVRLLKAMVFLFFSFLFFTLQYSIGFAIHWHESTTGVWN